MIAPLLRHNLGYKLISLGLAFMLWAYVQNAENPPLSRTIEVMPTISGCPPNLRASWNQRKVSVTVRDRKDAIARLRDTDLIAKLNLRSAIEGEHSFDVTISYSPRAQLAGNTPAIEKWEPMTYRFTLEPLLARQVKVTLEAEPPTGTRWLEAYVDPDHVMVKGPRSLLAQVRLVARVDRKSATVPADGDIQEKARLVVEDKNGQVIESSDVQVEPATVEFRGRLEVEAKQFHVQVTTTGAPATGFRVRGAIEAKPSTVMLAGSEEVLRQIDHLATEPIDLSGAIKSIERVVRLALPPNVKVRGPSRIRVTIPIVEISPVGNVPGPAPSRIE